MKTCKLAVVLFLTCASLSVFGQEASDKPEKKEKVKVEKPYTVHDKSFKVTRVDVRKDLKGVDNVIQLDASNSAGGTGMLSTQTVLPPAVISNINIVNGSYNQTREMNRTPRGMSLQLLDVVFPCRVRVTVGDQFIDLEIKEKGFWKVAIALAN